MNTIPVYFSPSMVAESGSYSPSAAKPVSVVASWQRLEVPLDVLAPTPATREELSQAHARAFVDGVLDGRALNGFFNRSVQVAASLPWTSGSMRSAAHHAWTQGGVAVAPCSGFHHAHWNAPADFCTFNGLMVTAVSLRNAGARRVGILDCDQHEGNGTDDIIRVLDAGAWVRHFTAGKFFHAPRDAGAFFAQLPEVLASMADCDVVLYQAGADPHVDDPLGGFLTTAQLFERDQLVFETLAARGVPVAWNLAGGYQVEADGSIPKVLEIHDNTLKACAAVYLRDP